MQTITLSVDALVAIREALKLTPQPDADEAWSEAWIVVRDAIAKDYDEGHQRTTSNATN